MSEGLFTHAIETKMDRPVIRTFGLLHLFGILLFAQGASILYGRKIYKEYKEKEKAGEFLTEEEKKFLHFFENSVPTRGFVPKPKD